MKEVEEILIGDINPDRVKDEIKELGEVGGENRKTRCLPSRSSYRIRKIPKRSNKNDIALYVLKDNTWEPVYI